MPRRRVRELMNPNVVCATPDMTIADVERLLARRRVGGVPVVDEDGHILGVITLNDCARYRSREMTVSESGSFFTTTDEYSDLRRAPMDLSQTPVEKVMSTTVYTVPPDASVAVAANVMRERRIHRLVVKERGRLVGMITSLDLLRVVEEQV